MRVKCSQRWSRAARCSSSADRPAWAIVMSRRCRALLRELDRDVLHSRVLLHGVGGQVLAVAGLLEAAVRHLGREWQEVLVDPHGAEVEPRGGLERPPDVT